MITKEELFVGELATVLSRGNCTVDARFQVFIDKYDPIILMEILGVDFYNQIVQALGVSPLASKWNILINGGSYQVNGTTYHFRGLKFITAGFIYYHYHRDNAFNPSSTGGQVPNLSEATYKLMSYKMASNWNEATNMIGAGSCPNWGTLHHYLINADFEGYQVKQYRGGKITGLGWL